MLDRTETRNSPDHLSDVQQMGLSHQEAVLYSCLVALGPSSARHVSESARMPREDSYRTLKRLEARGLVQVELGNPSIFVAVDPRTAVRSFVGSIERRSDELKEKAYELGVWLESIKDTASRGEVGPVNHESAVRILWGQQVFLELEKALKKCDEHYEGVLSPAAFLRSPNFGVVEMLASASSRGVMVRVITEETPQTIEAVRRYSRVFQSRSHEGVSQGMRFSIVDRSRIIMALSDVPAAPEHVSCLCACVPTLARGLGLYFEQTWRDSRPILDQPRRKSRAVGIS
jgi:sugar-specific transcriptional regulator TrmB